MRRRILLAKKFDHSLDKLTDLNEEVNGILLYRPQEQYCPIEAIFMTGIGNSGHVRAIEERIEIANKFFNDNPEYRFVKFHTHSRGTIRKFGEFYASNFSGGDINSYKEQLTTNPDFIGMVVTPKVKLLYAQDNPILKIVDTSPSVAQKRINDELNDIARRMSYNLDMLIGTIR